MKLQLIQKKIFLIRGQRVMLDFHLAQLYCVQTRALKQAVRRNRKRFPGDFMFQLLKKEWKELLKTRNDLHDHVKHSPTPPFAFTEQGIAMLSSVLRSEKAISINLSIMRAFVLLRQHLADYKELKEKIAELEEQMNMKFEDVFQAINFLMSPNGRRAVIKGFRKDAD